jgi:hypothetical protein
MIHPDAYDKPKTLYGQLIGHIEMAKVVLERSDRRV